MTRLILLGQITKIIAFLADDTPHLRNSDGGELGPGMACQQTHTQTPQFEPD